MKFTKFFLLGIFLILCTGFANAAIEDSLVSFYNLDVNSATQVDELGNNSLSVTGATFTTSGKINNAYDFDGAGDVLSASGEVINTRQDFSISIWFKTDDLSVNHDIISQWASSGNGYDNFRIKTDAAGKLFFQINDDIGYKTTTGTTVLSTGTWYHVMLVNWYGAGAALYLNNATEATVGSATAFSYGARDDTLRIGSLSAGGNDFNGIIDIAGVWTKALNSLERGILYADGDGKQYPFTESNITVNESVESTAVVKQAGTVTTTGPTPVTVFSSSFNVSVNNSELYGAYSFNVESASSNSLFCELQIDSVVVGNISRTQTPNVLGSVWLQSQFFSLTSGEHTQELICQRASGTGQIVISNSVGVGHFMIDEDNETIPHNETIFSASTSSSSFALLNEMNFTVSNRTTGGVFNVSKYLVIDWGGEYTNNVASEVLNTYVSIDDVNCSFYPRTVSLGGTGVVSGDCVLRNASAGVHSIKFYGKGTNADFNIGLKAKEFILSPEEIEGGTVFPAPTNFTGLTKLFNFTGGNLNHALTNVFQKVSFSISANQTTEANFYVKLVDGTDFQTINFSRDITSDIGVLIGQDVLQNIPQDNYVSELWADCGLATCTIEGGDGIGYVTDVKTTITNAFNVSVFDNFDDSVVLVFNVTDGATFSTTTGSLLYSIDKAFENLTILANDYFSTTILNHDTTLDLNVSLNQTLIGWDCVEKVSGNSLNCTSPLESTIFNYNVAGNPHTQIVETTGYFNYTETFNVTALQIETKTARMYSTNLTINSSSDLDTVSTCVYNITGVTYPSYTDSVIGSPLTTIGLIDGVYSVLADCTGFAYQTKNVTIVNNTQNLDFVMFTENSVNISFYDVNTNALITGLNITVQFIGATAQTNITNTGELYVDLLDPSEYTIVFDADGYRQNTYLFSLDNRSYTKLNLYMDTDNNTQLGLITVKNVFGNVVANADVTIQRYISDAWVTEQIRRTDFQGRTEASFVLTTAFYNFLVSVGDITYFGVVNSDSNKKQIYAEDISNGIEIIIDTNPDTTISSYQNIYDISTSFGFINTTNKTGFFRFIWDDSNNIQRDVNITVFAGGSVNCTSTASSESGTIYCFVNSDNTVLFTGYAYIDGELVGTQSYRIGTSDSRLIDWGAFGFGIAFLLVLLGFFMFNDNPTVSVMSGTAVLIGLIVFNVIFKNFNMAILSLIVVLAWIVGSIKSKSGVNT